MEICYNSIERAGRPRRFGRDEVVDHRGEIPRQRIHAEDDAEARGRGAHSSSVSKTASILTAEALHPILVYTFLNTPRADAVETMHMHHGTATHYLDEQANTLNGDYYTGRDRHTHGTMELVRSA